MGWLMLLAGLGLWVAAHLFKRLAPQRRAAMGQAGKGAVALGVGLGLVLMILGYRAADGAVWWGRTPMLTGINNLAMLLAAYLLIGGEMRAAPRRWLRHPMLTALLVWAAAHLLVNGDAPSLVLFGGLSLWALAEIALINRAEPAPAPPPAPGPRREAAAVIGALIFYAAAAGVHIWLGYIPFG